MSELRLLCRRDSLQEGNDCAWAMLDDAGLLKASGQRLEGLPGARRCRLVLAADLVLTVRVQLPELPERRLVPLLPAAAEAATLLEADAIHAVILAREPNGEAILAVVEDAWLSRIMARLAALGLQPDDALPDYLLLPWSEGQWSIGRLGGNNLARFDRAQGCVLDDGDPPVMLSLSRAHGARPQEARVYEDDGLGAPDWQRWRDALQLPLIPAGRWDWRTVPWPSLPGLLQGKYSPGFNRLDWKRLLSPTVIGVTALLIIQMLGMLVDWVMLSNENIRIHAEMAALAGRALPAHATVVDPAWQVGERLQNLRAAAGTPPPDAFLSLLERLGQAWPVGTGARLEALRYEAGTLTVSLNEIDPEWLDRLRTAAQARNLSVSLRDEEDARLIVRTTGRGADNGQ
ncbi:MAG TPA: type II secretion system protein GspL [Thiobacillaceae bacterium]|nr:type II secretion system protein GspL [Thiobacillaceae bacterium]HNU64069.1 type II secretion system protein GspL [Thiobacillaceae bacterium]